MERWEAVVACAGFAIDKLEVYIGGPSGIVLVVKVDDVAFSCEACLGGVFRLHPCVALNSLVFA